MQVKNTRYDSKVFKEKQKQTLQSRKDILAVLGLTKDSDQYKHLELRDDKDKAEYRALPEFKAISNLMLIHYKDGITDKKILQNARGVIVHKGNQIIRRSIPYSEVQTLDALTPNKNGILSLNATRLEKGDSSVIQANIKDIIFNVYVEGTVIDVGLANGQLHLWTSHNLLPRGVTVGGEVVRKKASLESFHTPFTDSFEEIVMESDPRILDKNYMFGAGAIFSPYIHRFILVTRERVKASTGYIPPKGYLIYLGPQKQWEYDIGMSAREYGRQYEPRPINAVLEPPQDRDQSYILFRGNIGLAEANAHLRGDTHVKDFRFQGGGKIIITGKDVDGNTFQSQIQSRSYAHRELILGPGTHPYVDFVIGLSLKDYDLTIEQSISRFWNRYGDFEIPHARDKIYPACNALEDLPMELKGSSTVAPATPLHTMWYNYLLCTNMCVRKEACMYLKRYLADREALRSWLPLQHSSSAYRGIERDPEGDSAKIRSFVQKTKAEIERTEGDLDLALLTISGVNAAKILNTCRKQTNTIEESIAISEPHYKVHGSSAYTIEI